MEGEEFNQQVPNLNGDELTIVIAPGNNSEECVKAEAVKRKRTEMEADAGKACNFPMQLIKIGEWMHMPKNHNEEITFRCYFKKAKFTWEALIGTTKKKAEYKWDIIQSIMLRENSGGGSIGILLRDKHRPSFYGEKDPQPKKHSEWESCTDFSNGHQASQRNLHDFHFETKNFNNLYKKIFAAADTMECLKKLIDPIAGSDVQTQGALPNRQHSGSNNNTCDPQVERQVAFIVQSQLYKELHLELPYLNPQLQHHPLPPYPPTFYQLKYENMSSSPILGGSFPTQRVLDHGDAINNCFPRITSIEGHNLLHQKPSLPFLGSPSSLPPQALAINPNEYGYQEVPEAIVDTTVMQLAMELGISDEGQNQDNSISPPTDESGASLYANNSVSPPTDGSGMTSLYVIANVGNSSSPPTDGSRSGAEWAPNVVHQRHQIYQPRYSDGWKQVVN